MSRNLALSGDHEPQRNLAYSNVAVIEPAKLEEKGQKHPMLAVFNILGKISGKI